MRDILIYNSLFTSIAEEMGEVLQKSAFSPNIKERRDFSCAIFDPRAALIAQAAHIPVHLGSMAYAVRSCLKEIKWQEGEAVILNDPYRGGTHLPDITLIHPVILNKRPEFFVAARAHHSDISGQGAASMGIAQSLAEEGVVLSPQVGIRNGKILSSLKRSLLEKVRNPSEREGDLQAQWAACQTGTIRLKKLVARYSLSLLKTKIRLLYAYSSKLMRQTIAQLRDGRTTAKDQLDDDGFSSDLVCLRVDLAKKGEELSLDFSKTDAQVRGPINTVPPVVASAIFYCIRSLSPLPIPENQGLMSPVRFRIGKKSLLSPDHGYPVSLGNVETSQRLVDLILRALAPLAPHHIPAASYGTMNNLSFASLPTSPVPFAFYETIAGGAGAAKGFQGTDAVHCHMTNTLNTPIEVIEQTLPLRLTQYAIRKGSGGAGKFRGGNGIVRSFLFEQPCLVSFVGERRKTSPYGLHGGEPGKKGTQYLERYGKKKKLKGKTTFTAQASDILTICTPGGGGWGKITK